MKCACGWPGRALASILLTLLLLTGCAPTTQRADVDDLAVQKERERQRRMVIRKDLEYQQRLARVAYPILRAARPLCQDDLGRRAGINISNIHAYPPEYRAAAHDEFGLDEYLRLLDVTPGSAAENAGLKPGDAIIGINGKQVRPGMSAVAHGQRQLDKVARSGDPFELVIKQGDENLLISFTPETICYYPVLLVDSNEINAYADGKNILITRGMMRFAVADQELAQVIAHELAHNAMGHIDAKKGNYALGTILDIAAAAYGVDTGGLFADLATLTYSQAFEAEADYVGLYAMARAGVPVAENADFWRRMAIEHPSSIEGGYLRTHPSTAERFVAIDNAVAEVEIKRSAGEALMPNMKRARRGPSSSPKAFSMPAQMPVATMSGAETTLPAGCWKSAGELKVGTAYRPAGVALTVGDRDAALIMDDGELVGLWQIKRQRLLKFEKPLETEAPLAFGFDCADLAAAGP